jgi:two-component system chemotaxis response regulator CheB
MKPVRVLIVEDSAVVRSLLTAIVRSDPRFEVAAALTNAEEALQRIGELAPDVISLDIRLPGMNGLEATRRIMSERPTPIVVIASSVGSDDFNIAMAALRSGALAVLEKPEGVESDGFRTTANHILTQLFIMSQVKVLRLWDNTTRTALRLPAMHLSAPDFRTAATPRGIPRAVAIGCSTGGPGALSALMRDLPGEFSAPILLVQHLPQSFIPNFARWIGTIFRYRVKLVADAEALRPGCLYLAGANHQLEVRGGSAIASDAPPVGAHRPSATHLFRSMAREFGSGAVGVLLTGMGEDGAKGLLEMRRAGAHTITEDATTAIVYGMPGAANALGASCESLPLNRIGPRLGELFKMKRNGPE